MGSIDGILKAFYEVVSGPKDQPRQWSRDRTLYIPDVRFVATGIRSRDSTVYAQIMSHEQFVDAANPEMVAEGFFEQEIHRVTQQFGNIAHVFSAYETRTSPDGPSLGRGVNSLELVWDGKRWWIASVVWDDERPGNPIPSEWLP